MPQSSWDVKNIGQLFLKMMDEYILFLEKRNLPMYFVPGNNLIGHLPNELLDQVIKLMRDIRKRPIDYIMKRLNLPGQRQLPSERFIELYENHIQSNLKDTLADEHLSHPLQATVLFALGEYHFHNNEFDTSIGVLHDALFEQEITEVNEDSLNLQIVSYLLEASQRVERLDDALKYASQIRTYLLSKPDEDRRGDWQQTMIKTTLSLARIHSVFSAKSCDTKIAEDHATKAQELYHQLLQSFPSHVKVNTEYAHHMINTGRVSDAISLLEKILTKLRQRMDDNVTQFVTTDYSEDATKLEPGNEDHSTLSEMLKIKTEYTIADRPVLNGELHGLVSSSTKSFEVASAIIAYYLLLDAYKQTGFVEKSTKLFNDVQGTLTKALYTLDEQLLCARHMQSKIARRENCR